MREFAIYFLVAMAVTGCKESGSGIDEPRIDDTKPSGIPNIDPLVTTNIGINIYWESAESPENFPIYSREDVDAWWTEVIACSGLSSEPPFVRLVDDVQDICPNVADNISSSYCRSLNPAPIVHAYGKFLAYTEHEKEGDRRSWKHEYLHHLGEMNGLFEHRSHEPDWLWQCQYN